MPNLYSKLDVNLIQLDETLYQRR